MTYTSKVKQVEVLEHFPDILQNATLTMISAAASESASRITIPTLILTNCELSFYQHVLSIWLSQLQFSYSFIVILSSRCLKASYGEERSDSFLSNIERMTFTLTNKALLIELTK